MLANMFYTMRSVAFGCLHSYMLSVAGLCPKHHACLENMACSRRRKAQLQKQSKCSWHFLQGVVIRLGRCDPVLRLIRLPCVSEKNVARPRPHFAACAHCRSLAMCIRSVSKVVGPHTCRSPVRPWTIEMLLPGHVLARCCNSIWRMRSSPATPSLAFPPARPGARRDMWHAPHSTLQLPPTAAVLKCDFEVSESFAGRLQCMPFAAVLKCNFEVFRRLRYTTNSMFSCGPGQSKWSSREMFW
jgi:hypothetical protein